MIGAENHKIKEIIKESIEKEFKSINAFCKEKGFRQATLSDFLTNKSEIRTSTLFKIMDELNLVVVKV